MVDVLNVFSHTGSNEPILKPLIGSFDLTFSLRRKGISYFYITIIQNLFPLRINFISKFTMVSPDGVPALHKAEDRMRVNIIGKGEAIGKDYRLESEDMLPGSFFFEEDRIKNKTAKII